MTQSSNEQTLKKWSDILNKVGLSGPKADWLEEYAKSHEQSEQSKIVAENTKAEDFPSLLPIAMRVAAKTISNDLIFASQEEINEVKNKVLTENRDGKIDAIVEGKDFTEKKLEDDEEYQKLMKKGVTPMSAPTGNLFYLDFKYESNHKKTRRAGKKHKKNKNGCI